MNSSLKFSAMLVCCLSILNLAVKQILERFTFGWIDHIPLDLCKTLMYNVQNQIVSDLLGTFSNDLGSWSVLLLPLWPGARLSILKTCPTSPLRWRFNNFMGDLVAFYLISNCLIFK